MPCVQKHPQWATTPGVYSAHTLHRAMTLSSMQVPRPCKQHALQLPSGQPEVSTRAHFELAGIRDLALHTGNFQEGGLHLSELREPPVVCSNLSQCHWTGARIAEGQMQGAALVVVLVHIVLY